MGKVFMKVMGLQSGLEGFMGLGQKEEGGTASHGKGWGLVTVCYEQRTDSRSTLGMGLGGW